MFSPHISCCSGPVLSTSGPCPWQLMMVNLDECGFKDQQGLVLVMAVCWFDMKTKHCVCVSVLPAISSCADADLLPMFLSRTPSHGDVLHATLGQTFQLYAQAQAQNAQYGTFYSPGTETHRAASPLTSSLVCYLSEGSKASRSAGPST